LFLVRYVPGRTDYEDKGCTSMHPGRKRCSIGVRYHLIGLQRSLGGPVYSKIPSKMHINWNVTRRLHNPHKAQSVPQNAHLQHKLYRTRHDNRDNESRRVVQVHRFFPSTMTNGKPGISRERANSGTVASPVLVTFKLSPTAVLWSISTPPHRI